MSNIHVSLEETLQGTSHKHEDNLADKLLRESHIIASGVFIGALHEAEKDPAGTAVKAVAAVGVGAVLGTAAVAASPWIAGAAAVAGIAGIGSWAWSTFNTMDPKNRERNRLLANSISSTWNSADTKQFAYSERQIQSALGKESLDFGLGLLSGVGAGSAVKYAPMAIARTVPEFGFRFFSDAAVARSSGVYSREFQVLEGSLDSVRSGGSDQLRVKEISGYDRNGNARLGEEKSLLLTHNGKNGASASVSAADADLIGCCEPQCLAPGARVKSVLQQPGRLFAEMDQESGRLRLVSEQKFDGTNDDAIQLASTPADRARYAEMLKRHIESPEEYDESRGFERFNDPSTNPTETNIAAMAVQVLNEELLTLDIPSHPQIAKMPDGTRALVDFETALRLRVPDLLTKDDVDAYLNPDNWIVIHDKGTAADHAKADILLANRATGHYFALDVTSSSESNAIIETNTALAGKKAEAASDRRDFIVVCSEHNKAAWDAWFKGDKNSPYAKQMAEAEKQLANYFSKLILEKTPFQVDHQELPYADKFAHDTAAQLRAFQDSIKALYPAWASELDKAIHAVQRELGSPSRTTVTACLPEFELVDCGSKVA